MNQYINPAFSEWESISKRPTLSLEDLDEKVQHIINRVKTDGDQAIKEFALQFDKVSLENIKVNSDEIEFAKTQVSEELKQAISVASDNIRKFHTSQKVSETTVETMEGITCWRKNVAIENVGLYIREVLLLCFLRF